MSLEKKGLESVPYVVFESAEARSERHIKRLIIALIISISVGLVTNLAWLYVWNQYDYESESITRTFVQDGEGLNIIGDSNEVTHGTTSDVYEAEENPN